MELNQESLVGIFIEIVQQTGTINEAENALQHFYEEKPMEFLILSLTLLLRDDIDIKILQMAMVIAYKVIKPTNINPLHIIAEKYLNYDNENYRDVIKQCVLRGIMFNDLIIISHVASIIVVILHIEKDNWLDIVPLLLSISSDSIVYNGVLLGPIKTIGMIAESDIPYQFFESIIDKLKSYLFLSIQEGSTYSSESALCLSHIIDRYSIINDENEANMLLDMLFITIQSSNSDIDIVSSVLVLLYSVFVSLYESIERYIEKIFDLVFIPIRNEKQEIIKTGLLFWEKAAKFEINILKTNSFYLSRRMKKTRHFADVVGKAMIAFISPLLENLYCIDSKDTEITIDKNERFSDYIEELLTLMFILNGNEVMIQVFEFYHSNEANNWINCYAKLYALNSIITSESLEKMNFGRIANEIFELLDSFIMMMKFNIPVLQEKVMKIISDSIRVYHLWVLQEDSLDLIITLIEESCGLDPHVIIQELAILSEIITSFPKGMNNCPLSTYFSRFIIILNTISSRNDAIIEGLFDEAYKIISLMVLYAGEMMNSNILEIYYQAKCILVESLDVFSLDCSDNQYIMQKNMCNLVHLIVHRKDPQVVLDGSDMIRILERILQQRSRTFEEAIQTIGSFIIVLKEDFLPYTENIMGYIYDSFLSNNSNIIIMSTYVLGDLFLTLKDKMEPYLDSTFEQLVPFLFEPSTRPELAFRIIYMLSDAIRSVSNVKQSYRDSLFDRIGHWASGIIFDGYGADLDIEYAEFYEVVFYSLQAVLFITNDSDEAFLSSSETIFLSVLSKFCQCSIFHENVLFEMLHYIIELPIKYGNRIVRKILSKATCEIIEIAKNDKNKKLADFAAKAKHTLMNFKK